ncbi:hypothetical protein TSAR_007841 [Trichomalopsis sarcophagae]|uniref:Fatty acid desaturase domain-containing protein n=1 Tax=Trichomalopsis sarcophagae TaxID=543379 RepID=A0A232FMY3_9HYME|nr:hypothetical protein TSAR_007841 [Trichomalopsis sarcophagae]
MNSAPVRIKDSAMYSSTVTQFEEAPNKVEEDSEPSPLPVKEEGEQPWIWRNIIGIAILHVLAVYSFATRYHEAKLGTWIFNWKKIDFVILPFSRNVNKGGSTAGSKGNFNKEHESSDLDKRPIWGITAGLGITAGAHRLWAHRSYSAKTPLRIFLAILYCMAGMTHFHKWIRDHRTHHKFTETAADPHDANRGFFFSHVGWLMMKRHPAVKKYGSKVDMSDIEADPVIQFFDRYYEPIMMSLTFVIPTLIPVYCWGESWYCAIHSVIIRYVWLLNATFLVNSFAHMWGNRPYNSNVKPTENATVSFFTLGEGWHNYHHSFPWDYKAAELPGYGLNASTGFIQAMAWLGLAYDLKTPSKELIEKVSVNKGDGTASKWGNDHHRRQREQQKVKTR